MTAAAIPPHDVADLSLAPAGAARIAWADAQMPVLRSIRERFAAASARSRASRSAACLHVTAETANLVRALVAGGAEVALCAANPLSTQDDVAAALVDDYGVEVHARHGEDARRLRRARRARCVAGAPHVTLDDGADLLRSLPRRCARDVLERLHRRRPRRRPPGSLRLRALEAEGRLAVPGLAVNEARTERAFNDRYGTGQSALDGILRATNILLAGQTVVVVRLRLDRPRHRRSAPAAPARRSSSARSTRCARWRRGWRASR